MKKHFSRITVLLLVLSFVWISSVEAAQNQFKFGGGTSGGPWFVAVGGAVQMFNEKLAGKYGFTYGASGGSVENIRRIMTYEYDMAFVHSTQLWEAVNSEGLFKDQPKVTNLKLLARVSEMSNLWVVLKASGIKSLYDIEGKKVNTGPPGSGSHVNSLYILEALGLDRKIRVQNLTYDLAARSMADRQIDVFAGTGNPFTLPAITEISQTNEISYIPLTKEEIDKITAKYPFYFPVTMPAGTVRGVNEPVEILLYSVYWVVNDKTPDDVVKSILETVTAPANKTELANIQPIWGEVNGDFSGVSKLGIPVHKAAAEFWISQGQAMPEGMPIQ